MVREKAASYYVTYGNVHVHVRIFIYICCQRIQLFFVVVLLKLYLLQHAVVFICLGWLMVSVTEILKILEITDKPKDLLHLPLFIFCYLCAYFGNRHLRPCCYIPAIVLNVSTIITSLSHSVTN